MTDSDPDYPASYSEQGFWRKLSGFAKVAGKDVVEKSLLLFYAAQKDNVPAWAKATIVASLGYFISPIDAIPDLMLGVGYADDLGVLAMAIATVTAYIDDDVREKAQIKIHKWFN